MYVLRAQQFGYLGFAVRGRQCHSPLFGLNIGVSVYLIVCYVLHGSDPHGEGSGHHGTGSGHH